MANKILVVGISFGIPILFAIFLTLGGHDSEIRGKYINRYKCWRTFGFIPFFRTSMYRPLYSIEQAKIDRKLSSLAIYYLDNCRRQKEISTEFGELKNKTGMELRSQSDDSLKKLRKQILKAESKHDQISTDLRVSKKCFWRAHDLAKTLDYRTQKNAKDQIIPEFYIKKYSVIHES